MDYIVPGLHTRRPNCKICQAFDDTTLAEITMDILLQRRTWVEVSRHYTPLLPAGLTPITDINIKNHKKHCDPKRVAASQLRASGKPSNELEQLESVYSELVNKEIHSQEIVRKTFFDRIQNAKILQDHITHLRRDYEKIPADGSTVNQALRGQLLSKISPRVLELDAIYRSLQEVALRDVDLQKDRSGESLLLIQTIVLFFQEQLRSFGQEMVNYLLLEEFANEPERGKQVLKRLSGIMDLFLAPALDHKRLFKTVSKRVVENAEILSETNTK